MAERAWRTELYNHCRSLRRAMVDGAAIHDAGHVGMSQAVVLEVRTRFWRETRETLPLAPDLTCRTARVFCAARVLALPHQPTTMGHSARAWCQRRQIAPSSDLAARLHVAAAAPWAGLGFSTRASACARLRASSLQNMTHMFISGGGWQCATPVGPGAPVASAAAAAGADARPTACTQT